MKTKLVLAFTLASLAMFGALQEAAAQRSMGGGMMVDGEVRRVDKNAGKLTIRHGAASATDMPPMTMVYRAKDPAMLDQVKAGDKVKLSTEKAGGEYTVTKIEPVK